MLNNIKSHITESQNQLNNLIKSYNDLEKEFQESIYNKDYLLYKYIMDNKNSTNNGYMINFYEESPTWKIDNIDEIIKWEFSENKLDKLNNDLDSYFSSADSPITFDGEIS